MATSGRLIRVREVGREEGTTHGSDPESRPLLAEEWRHSLPRSVHNQTREQEYCGLMYAFRNLPLESDVAKS